MALPKHDVVTAYKHCLAAGVSIESLLFLWLVQTAQHYCPNCPWEGGGGVTFGTLRIYGLRYPGYQSLDNKMGDKNKMIGGSGTQGRLKDVDISGNKGRFKVS